MASLAKAGLFKEALPLEQRLDMLSQSTSCRHAVYIRFGQLRGLGFYQNKPPEEHEQLVVCAELFGQRFRYPVSQAGPRHNS